MDGEGEEGGEGCGIVELVDCEGVGVWECEE